MDETKKSDEDNLGYLAAGLEMFGDILGGLMQQKAANAAGNAMYANEGTLRRQAASTVATGLENQRRALGNYGSKAGEEIAKRGSSGITAEGSGSAGEQTVLEQMRSTVNDIGYQAQSENKRLNYQADLSNYQGRMMKHNGKFDVLGTTLGMAGSMFGGLVGGSPAAVSVGYQAGKLAGTGIRTLGQ